MHESIATLYSIMNYFCWMIYFEHNLLCMLDINKLWYRIFNWKLFPVGILIKIHQIKIENWLDFVALLKILTLPLLSLSLTQLYASTVFFSTWVKNRTGRTISYSIPPAVLDTHTLSYRFDTYGNKRVFSKNQCILKMKRLNKIGRRKYSQKNSSILIMRRIPNFKRLAFRHADACLTL